MSLKFPLLCTLKVRTSSLSCLLSKLFIDLPNYHGINYDVCSKEDSFRL